MAKPAGPKEGQEQREDEEREDKFEHLPDDVLGEIGKHLLHEKEGKIDKASVKDLGRLTRTHKRAHGIFKPALDTMAITKLLEYVVHGEQDEAEKMITSYPELLTMRGTVTDYSGRTFENITPFEYTLWALDKHMWEMMLKALSDNKKGSEIKLNLLQQYQDHISNQGVHYTSDGKAHTELHYDFALRDKLQEYVDKFDGWTGSKRNNYWCTKIGGAQRMVPCHVANEYCHPFRSFDPPLQFKEETLPRNLVFYNCLSDTNESWFPLEASGLGSSFGILRGRIRVRSCWRSRI
jgi:hypothetical protein